MFVANCFIPPKLPQTLLRKEGKKKSSWNTDSMAKRGRLAGRFVEHL